MIFRSRLTKCITLLWPEPTFEPKNCVRSRELRSAQNPNTPHPIRVRVSARVSARVRVRIRARVTMYFHRLVPRS